MTALDLLIQLTERAQEDLLSAARQLPTDRLDWKPAPGARSALDQLQECATLIQNFREVFTTAKLEMTPERYQAWVTERASLTDLDVIEQSLRANTAELVEVIRQFDPERMTDPVELPFPVNYNFADMLANHLWNMSYHQGQINYIRSLLES